MALSKANFIVVIVCSDGAILSLCTVPGALRAVKVMMYFDRALKELSLDTSFVFGDLFFSEIWHFQMRILFF